MKKNKFMRLASGLLVGTLLTTCAISGTFAKYTTQDAAEDSARVAKWGVELQIIGDLYSDTYGDNIRTTWIETDPTTDDGEAYEVRASAEGQDVVAPGTKNDTGLTIKLNGKPEVDHQLKVVMATENIYLTAGTYGIMVAVDAGVVTEDNYADLVKANGALYCKNGDSYTATKGFADGASGFYTLEDVVVNPETYYPVVYNLKSLKGTDITTNYVNNGLGVTLAAGEEDGTATDTIKNIADDIFTKLNPNGTATTTVEDGKTTWAEFTSEIYETNSDIAVSTGLSDVTLSWAWQFTDKDGSEFDGNFVATGEDVDDGLDTILGHLQAGNVNVVKDSGNDTFVTPSAAAGTKANDYNLETSFMLDITVNQID